MAPASGSSLPAPPRRGRLARRPPRRRPPTTARRSGCQEARSLHRQRRTLRQLDDSAAVHDLLAVVSDDLVCVSSLCGVADTAQTTRRSTATAAPVSPRLPSAPSARPARAAPASASPPSPARLLPTRPSPSRAPPSPSSSASSASPSRPALSLHTLGHCPVSLCRAQTYRLHEDHRDKYEDDGTNERAYHADGAPSETTMTDKLSARVKDDRDSMDAPVEKATSACSSSLRLASCGSGTSLIRSTAC